jgi:hypothetical protein
MKQHLTTLCYSPLDMEIRRYLEKLYEKTSDLKKRNELKEKETQIISAFKTVYFENQIGEYELSCSYLCREVDPCDGLVQSEPELFSVTRSGALTDQIDKGFRRRNN